MTAGSSLTPAAVRDLLRKVKYPGFSRDIVSFGIVQDVGTDGGSVRLRLHLPAENQAVADAVETGTRAALLAAAREAA